MSIYFRLLGYLKPYRLRLLSAIACMVIYAAASAISLGFVAPFMKVLFERGRPESAVAARCPEAPFAGALASPGAAAGAAVSGADGWTLGVLPRGQLKSSARPLGAAIGSPLP